MNVEPIKKQEAYPWLLYKHYAKRIPQIIYAFGLFRSSELVGVITYGLPPSPSLCKGVCGEEYRHQVLELNRVCLESNAKNEGSFLVANSIKLLPKPTIIISYADTKMGHIGYIYQATNFLYTGLSDRHAEWQIEGLENTHSKTISNRLSLEEIKDIYGERFKYTERSRKHRYVFFHATKKQKQQLRAKLRYPVLSYPKGKNLQYDSGESLEVQRRLF